MSAIASLSTSLFEALSLRNAQVVVIGAGYVGLGAAVEAARAGFPVIALDLDAERVQMLEAGRSYITDISDDDLGPLVGAGRLRASTDFSHLAAADVILICVPTPLTPNRVPDLTCVRQASESIATHARPGQLISLESTTYPGTTEEELLPLLTARGLKAGEDLFLVFCPERIDPGNKQAGPRGLVRVLGGVTPVCREVGEAFYRSIAGDVLPVSSTRTAEMTKLFENIYRAVNIALVNEMALLCDRMGMDVWEVLQASASKGFGIHPFRPGPGVGGHCIPLDPHYLAWKAKEFDFTLRFVELAGEINATMPYFVVNKLARLLNDSHKSLRGARVLLLGVAYKKDVGDARESPAYRIIQLLTEAGVQVEYHDPLVPVLAPHGPVGQALFTSPLSPELLSNVDAALILTDHSGIDYQALADRVPVLLDTRGVADLQGKHVYRL